MASKDKYDRQLRLWGTHGQKAMAFANVLLIGGNSVGSETLKNLVLPGIGKFTILDNAVVTMRDTGNNFFVTEDHIGKSRAKTVMELLVEMNSDVEGVYRDADVKTVIENEPGYFKEFTLIIASNIPDVTCRGLAKLCWDFKVPLIMARANGLVGSCRLVYEEHTIVESKGEGKFFDLRLAKSFDSLADYCDEFDMGVEDSAERAHIPFVVILKKCADLWKAGHGGKLPDDNKRVEKEEFKESIKKMINPDKEWGEELNFVEAYNQAHLAYCDREIKNEVADVIDMLKDVKFDSATSDFWVMVKAVKEFIDAEGNGQMPVGGEVPDMVSTTESYVKLQQVYHEKAIADLNAVAQRVAAILTSVGAPVSRIGRDSIQLFCRNAFDLWVIKGRSLEQELDPSTARCKEEFPMQFFDPDTQNPLLWYVVLLATERFYTKFNRYPGESDVTLDEDAKILAQEGSTLAQELGLQEAFGEIGLQWSLTPDYYKEMCRFGGSEIHNIAAHIGGVASQEAVKMITHQYAPINNTYIFNGIASKATVYEA